MNRRKLKYVLVKLASVEDATGRMRHGLWVGVMVYSLLIPYSLYSTVPGRLFSKHTHQQFYLYPFSFRELTFVSAREKCVISASC